MNINMTLFGQSIAFFVFVWFCMKFIWPPLTKMLDERKQTIADGLAAAEKGKHDEELAKKRALETLKKAKEQAAEIIAGAQKRAGEIVDEAKGAAHQEADRIKAAATAELEQEVNRAREHLRGEVVSLAVAGAGRVLKREIDAKANEDLLKDLVAQL
ncbi:MAG: F0F1 ATP synthase subunit B [Pseudomonadota bacterium]|nr:MAG: F0F1 ATP synthase subunit B [Pseudomonadota bacterium]